jgi:hypothetical protein
VSRAKSTKRQLPEYLTWLQNSLAGLLPEILCIWQRHGQALPVSQYDRVSISRHGLGLWRVGGHFHKTISRFPSREDAGVQLAICIQGNVLPSPGNFAWRWRTSTGADIWWGNRRKSRAEVMITVSSSLLLSLSLVLSSSLPSSHCSSVLSNFFDWASKDLGPVHLDKVSLYLPHFIAQLGICTSIRKLPLYTWCSPGIKWHFNTRLNLDDKVTLYSRD